jgi:hypothetical protein
MEEEDMNEFFGSCSPTPIHRAWDFPDMDQHLDMGMGMDLDMDLPDLDIPDLDLETPQMKKPTQREMRKQAVARNKQAKLDKPLQPPKTTDFRTIATQTLQIRMPRDVDDVQQCIVDALGSILPLDAKVMIFGFWHSVILVGVMYRHENLCWIMLNRANMKLYLVCHFLSDGIHLFDSIRYKLNTPISQLEKKWNRQGASEVLCVFQSFTNFSNRTWYRLNQLPREILRFNRSAHSLQKATEFLRGVGAGGDFLQRFMRQAPLRGFNPVIYGLTEATRGWKVFNPTRSISRQCITGKRQLCCAEYVAHLENSGFKDMDLVHQAMAVVKIIPTRLDSVDNEVLRNHYDDFVRYVRANQSVMFTPVQDVRVDDLIFTEEEAKAPGYQAPDEDQKPDDQDPEDQAPGLPDAASLRRLFSRK